MRQPRQKKSILDVVEVQFKIFVSNAISNCAFYSQRGCQATSHALAPSRIHGVGSAPVKVSLAA